jgi:RNA polymerase sigma-70 factor (ECF subfamily)
VVLAAGDGADPDASVALEALCRTYWYPLYAYARRGGQDSEHAQDLVQGFFGKLLATGGLGSADPERGRFRSYLLTSFRNFTINQAERENALKRGGGQRPISFDASAAEPRLSLEPSHERTPERLFLRDWALTVIEQAMGRVRTRYVQRGQEVLFDAAREFLVGGRGERNQAEGAAEVGVSEGAFRVAISRIRARFRDALREEVAHTVEGHTIDEELAELLGALAL